MDEIADKYPNIGDIFGFFGQDWKLMFDWEEATPNYKAAIRKLRLDSDKETLDKSVNELKSLLRSGFNESQLHEVIVSGFGSAFHPPGIGMTYGQWLVDILRILQEPESKTESLHLPRFVDE